MDLDALDRYRAESRDLVLDEIQRMIPRASPVHEALYGRMLAYVQRSAKALRPAICLATCAALGGHRESALPSAGVIELYHNAFLIHDDVEDGSERRRGLPTLHTLYGMPTAVNVGDAMLALALAPLLDNMRTLGMGKALRILQAVSDMARESAEGQAMELEWTRHVDFTVSDADYVQMVEKKTAWYSFVTPMVVGAVVAGASPEVTEGLQRFGMALGVAFQIQDDVLDLVTPAEAYGKDACGDLLEGKHTLALLHMVRSATPTERARALAILRKPRPPAAGPTGLTTATKTQDDVHELRMLMEGYKSVPYARDAARARSAAAGEALRALDAHIRPSVHQDFLHSLVGYVTSREH